MSHIHGMKERIAIKDIIKYTYNQSLRRYFYKREDGKS